MLFKDTFGKSSTRKGKTRSRIIRSLGVEDQLVEYFKPTVGPQWMDQQQWEWLPDSIDAL